MLVPRQKKGGHGAVPDALAWMMSYADMATILLAMFIVLSTFAKDQSGISLYYGTGSFEAAMSSFGLPGLMSNSSQVIPLKAPGPQHSLPAQDNPETGPENSSAKDRQSKDKDDSLPERVIDGEQENFQRFLSEMDRHFKTAKMPRTAGETSLDFYEKLNKKSPHLSQPQQEQLAPLMPLLRQPGYHVEVIVWAGTPRDTATSRSAEEAADVAEELANGAGLDAAARRHLIAVGQSWPYRDIQRPVMSVVVTRTDGPPVK
jgi:Membrane MotB of proton-channel complex MotA/MotB